MKIFAAFVGVNLNVVAKISHVQLQLRIYITYCRRLSDSCDMFANSSGKFKVIVWFQVKAQFDLSKLWLAERPSSVNSHSLIIVL